MTALQELPPYLKEFTVVSFIITTSFVIGFLPATAENTELLGAEVPCPSIIKKEGWTASSPAGPCGPVAPSSPSKEGEKLILNFGLYCVPSAAFTNADISYCVACVRLPEKSPIVAPALPEPVIVPSVKVSPDTLVMFKLYLLLLPG